MRLRRLLDRANGQYLLRGDLSGLTATDGVVTYDNVVRVQEGVILAGSSFVNPVDDVGIVGAHLDQAEHYFVRGNNDATEDDWVYRDGVGIVAGDEPIHTGATELWTDAEFADCFFLHVGNARGDFVIGGVTTGPRPRTACWS